MDTATLVEEMIDDGRRLLMELERDHFEVMVAFWAKRGEPGRWQLRIASKAVDASGAMPFHQVVREALRRLPDPMITSEEVRLIGANDPMAKDALAIRQRQAGTRPIRYDGRRLGNTVIDDAYIYPLPPIRMTPEDAIARMVSLVQRHGVTRPSVVSLRDGSSFQAIAAGLDLTTGGPMNLRFIDTASNQPRVFTAQEVVGID